MNESVRIFSEVLKFDDFSRGGCIKVIRCSRMVDQAEIHRKVASGDAGERSVGVEQLRSNFADLPDKDEAWEDLIHLTRDEDTTC